MSPTAVHQPPATPATKKPNGKASDPAAAAKKATIKAAKLRELAGKRVPNAVKAIALVGNLAAYAPTSEQSDAIMKALSTEVSRTGERLRGAKPVVSSFALPGV